MTPCAGPQRAVCGARPGACAPHARPHAQHLSVRKAGPSARHCRQAFEDRPSFVASAASSEPAALADVAAPAAPGDGGEREVREGVLEGYWTWRGNRIRYTRSGSSGPPLVLVHGFGGNADHWRKNVGPLASAGCRVWAVDLLGYGYSDKPSPKEFDTPNALYNFDTWSAQLRDFAAWVAPGEPAFFICNSVGGIAGLQAALDDPTTARGVQVLNISLRMLHVSKQAPWQRPLVSGLQRVLRETSLGAAFFGNIATPQSVRRVLRQCYGDPAAVTDELVEAILRPGLTPGALDVFLDFISYSSGPLPEELLEEVSVPVSVVWGEADPWERLEWGRELAKCRAVEEFISLPGVGHCPQDEAPEQVNPLVLDFVRRHMPLEA